LTRRGFVIRRIAPCPSSYALDPTNSPIVNLLSALEYVQFCWIRKQSHGYNISDIGICFTRLGAVTSPPTEPDTKLRLARALGSGYEIRRLVGRGGFAEVYEAWDRELERRLAVKVLRPDVAWTSGMLQRFKQETRAVARLQDSNILPIHFVGEGEGLCYYVMPYVEGHSLGQLLRGSGALSPKHALDIAIPVLGALQHAHERGLIHRDIKPDNIMIDTTSGRPLLMDFGIAKRLDSDGGLTQTGFVVGTPYYMSPEQALGQGDLDARSDIYSFGAVLFQMVTGTPPFDGESSQEIVGKHLAEPPPTPNEVNQQVPPWLSEVIVRCLQKKPVERFQSAHAVVEALTAGQDTQVAEPAVASPWVGAVDPTADTEVVNTTVPLAVSKGRRGLWRRLFVIGLPLIGVGILAVWWLARPRLVFENPLAAPVTVSVGSERYLVEPRANVIVPLHGGGQIDVMWAVERPANPDGRPLGAEVVGMIALADPHGRVRGSADATPGERAYFSPLITNETDVSLTVFVNAATPHEMPCDCTVPPGSHRMLIGYYPLFSNSTVRAVDESGRSAIFTDFASEVNRRTGVVGLRFEEKDLR
jgi:hypothetical protein